MRALKSKALAIGGWSTTTKALDIDFHSKIKILGVNYTGTVERSMNKSWAHITGNVRAQGLRARLANAILAGLPLRQDLAHRTDLSGPYSVYATAESCRCVVHMAGSNFPGAYIDTPETEEGTLQ